MKRGTRGFTLIELLVVIAVIAVLMSILMPVLGKARKQAWKVTCQSNMRQIGVAANLFAEDHDYRIPRGGDAADLPGATRATESTRWFRAFMRYLAEKPLDGDYRNVKMYRCKAYPDRDQTVCYLVNAWKDGSDEYRGLCRLLDIRRRGDRVYLGEHEYNEYRPVITEEDTPGYASVDVFRIEHLGHSELDQVRRVAQKRHKQGYNALFLDWHVGYVAVDQDDMQSKFSEIRSWDLYGKNGERF